MTDEVGPTLQAALPLIDGTEALERLGRVAEVRDRATFDHAARVGTTAVAIAARLGWDSANLAMLRWAAPLHDIGKIGTPDHILGKPGPLTAEEFAEVRRHTTLGAQIMSGGTTPVVLLAEEICLTHHERWDGTGYMGLRGVEIPLASRIVSVADVHDALISERPYKPAWSEDRALSHLLGQRGSDFDPDVIDAFLWLVEAAHGTPGRLVG